MIDVLHTVDLGVAAHIVGSVFWLIVFIRKALGGRNQMERLGLLQADLKLWYQRNPSSSHQLRGKLTLDKIKAKGQWAKLKGKAVAIRHVVPYALHLMVQHGDGSTDDKLATAICELLVRFYYILNSQSMFLTATIKEELPKLGQRLAQYYQILSSNAIRANFQIWKMTPKLHLWLHLR